MLYGIQLPGLHQSIIFNGLDLKEWGMQIKNHKESVQSKHFNVSPEVDFLCITSGRPSVICSFLKLLKDITGKGIKKIYFKVLMIV